MKKRRPCTRNHFPSQKYSHIHERFPIRTRSTYDSKGRNSKRKFSKLQQSNGSYNTKEDAFESLESLFDLKKPLNLRDVYPLAFDYYKKKSIQGNSVEAYDTKSEFLVETLFLQHISSETDPEDNIFHTNEIHDKTENEQKIETKLEKKEFQTTISNSVQKLQKNVFIRNQQNRSINMAENGEVPEEQEKKPVDEDAKEKEPIETEEDLVKSEIEPEEKKTDEEEGKDKIEDKADLVEYEIEPEEKKKDEEEGKDKDEEERKDKAEDEEEYKDKDEDKKDKIDKDDEDKIKDKSDLIGEPLLDSALVDVTKGLAESIISSPLLTDDIITKLKAMDERCVVLVDEIQQLKREVQELSEKPELTEEDTFEIQQKQDVIMSKVAELEQLTQKFHETQVQQIESLTKLSEIEILKEKEKEEEEIAKDQIDQVEAFKKVLEKDFFETPQIEYPEDKLPRIIFCGYTEDKFPRVVIAETERKGKVKCLEKLTGKLTESLTMQEKLVKENAQLEDGRYKLEEALLEKDTALENLQKKVCNLQAEMRIIVEENTELSRQLAILNQLVTARSTRCYTCSGITPSPPTSPSSLPARSHVQFRDDVYCQCKCCLQSQFTDILSPTTETDSPRLTGGGSKTEEHYFTDSSALQNVEMCSRSPVTVKPSLPRGTCPAELEDKLMLYGTNTQQLEQQLGSMETEVRNMQMELANVQKERRQLEQQRKLLKCTGPCAPCSCPPPPPICMPMPGLPSKGPAVSAVSTAQLASTDINAQQQLRDLREQYARLQDDYKSKLCEVSCMRTEAEKMKQDIRDVKEEKERMEIKLIDVQERLKLLKSEKGKFEGNKEQLIEKEQALIVAKQRFREAQDELDELRSLIQDQAAQLEDYRNKYLQAQQQVEEQRRQLDLMEMDNARMNENVTLEIGRVKNQFQEKLAELAPLPDILKQMQIKMQEAQQMRLIAEHNSEDLSRELLGSKDKIQTLQNQLDTLHAEHRALQVDENGSGKFEEMEKKYNELRHENERMKHTVARFEEHEAQLQKRIDEKMHENTQLSSMLDQIREDSARQVARTKERCETMRRSMQGQIAEMERQLAQCRATARAAQRDRDEIRQKMQGQITNLNEAFKHAQGRIKSLQGHVNYLKTSYSNIFLGQGETPTGALPRDDSCDCNY